MSIAFNFSSGVSDASMLSSDIGFPPEVIIAGKPSRGKSRPDGRTTEFMRRARETAISRRVPPPARVQRLVQESRCAA
jgi:hypothetical protein